MMFKTNVYALRLCPHKCTICSVLKNFLFTYVLYMFHVFRVFKFEVSRYMLVYVISNQLCAYYYHIECRLLLKVKALKCGQSL